MGALMFSLQDIDDQIAVFVGAADNIETKADTQEYPPFQSLLRCHASALRECARSLERMIERAVEREAREAMNR